MIVIKRVQSEQENLQNNIILEAENKKYKDKIKRIKAVYQENFYNNYKLITDKIKTILYD